MSHFGHRIRTLAGGLFALLAIASAQARAQEVTIYTTRDAELTVPILDRFTSGTNILTKLVHFKSAKELQDRLVSEGAASPADLAIVPDMSGLFDLVAARMTQSVPSPVLDNAVPAHLKHPTNMWVGLSYRIRAIAVAKTRASALPETYQDLTDPRFQGRFCIGRGADSFNAAWIAAMLLKDGEGLTAMYLQGLKRNLARTPAGDDRDVVRDIASGICDVGVANTSAMAQMLTGADGQEQKAWAEAAKIVIPTFPDRAGAHVSISGAAVLLHAPNRMGAIRLLDYLVSEEGQQAFAELALEYPVRAGVPVHPILAGFGTPNSDPMTLSGIAAMLAQSNRLVSSVAFDAPVRSARGTRTAAAR